MAVADGALTRVAIIREVTQGTTPSNPAFNTVRTVTAQATPQSNRAPSDDERRSDRALGSTYQQVGGAVGRIDCKLCDDDALDILFESLMGSQFASDDTVENGTSKLPFTQENTYEQGGTDTYVRTTGNLVNSMSFSGRVDAEIQLSFDIMGMGGSADNAIIAGASYIPASNGECFSVIDSVVTNFFNLASPRVASLDFTVNANVRKQAAFGSADPFGLGIGRHRVEGTAEIYFESKAQLDAALENKVGPIDISFGSASGQKYRFYFPSAEIMSYEIVDGGNDTDHFLRLNWIAKYDATDGFQMQIERHAT